MKTLLFNPFQKYSEKQLLITGIVATILGSYLGYYFHFRFDGVLDCHIKISQSYLKVLADNLLSIFSLALFLLVAAKYINKKSRIIDIFSITVISRIPTYFLSFININNVLENTTEKLESSVKAENLHAIDISSHITLLIMGFASLLFLIWSMVLLFNGFKIAANTKGTLHIILFISAIILAEALSKILIQFLN